MKKLISTVVTCIALVIGLTTTSHGQESLRADVINVWFDPDKPPPAGQTWTQYFQNLEKKFVYVYREIIPVEVGGYTYFAILGANHGKEFPTFYGGIQQYKDGTRYAIFSAWDVNSDTQCWTCKEGTASESEKVTVWSKGTRTRTSPFGNEGTGMNSMIDGFNWQLGVKVGMLVSVEPAGSGSLISAAFKYGSEPWEFMTSFYVPSRYDNGMPGNYSFLEDWVGGDENVPRSYLVGPTYLEDEDGKGTFYTKAYVFAGNPTGSKIANRHTIAVEGSWLRVRAGIPIQVAAKADYWVQLGRPSAFPDISDGKALIEKAVAGKSTRYQERLVKQEKEAAAKAIAEGNAKAEAEAKAKIEAAAKAEAEAKAAAELKAKQEVDAKAAAEQKAKQEAEAKAAAEKAAAELKAKAEAAKKKTTITCIKGKLTKKVTAVNPKCPKGYKKK